MSVCEKVHNRLSLKSHRSCEIESALTQSHSIFVVTILN